jgi:nucleoside-diphosphate-sugar epimerase
MIRILITGGAGYIGSVLTAFLLKNKKYHVTIFDNLMYGGDHLISYIYNKNFEFIKGDIRSSSDLIAASKNKDIIIHLAAIVGYPACSGNPKLANDVNTTGTKNILNNISKNQSIFYASTGSNYGSLDEICTENSKINPLTTYAKTKAKAEEMIIERNNYIAYRFATAFGISPRMRLDLLVNDFVYKMMSQSYLVVYEKKFMRTFIHIKDIARSFEYGIENFTNMKNQVYNVGNEKLNYSKEDVCNLIQSKLPGYIYFAEIGEDKDKRNYIVSYKKISKTGFKLNYSIEEGIDELIRTIPIINLKSKFSNV